MKKVALFLLKFLLFIWKRGVPVLLLIAFCVAICFCLWDVLGWNLIISIVIPSLLFLGLGAFFGKLLNYY